MNNLRNISGYIAFFDTNAITSPKNHTMSKVLYRKEFQQFMESHIYGTGMSLFDCYTSSTVIMEITNQRINHLSSIVNKYNELSSSLNNILDEDEKIKVYEFDNSFEKHYTFIKDKLERPSFKVINKSKKISVDDILTYYKNSAIFKIDSKKSYPKEEGMKDVIIWEEFLSIIKKYKTTNLLMYFVTDNYKDFNFEDIRDKISPSIIDNAKIKIISLEDFVKDLPIDVMISMIHNTGIYNKINDYLESEYDYRSIYSEDIFDIDIKEKDLDLKIFEISFVKEKIEEQEREKFSLLYDFEQNELYKKEDLND